MKTGNNNLFDNFYEILKMSPFIKSDFFGCENEVRIVYVYTFREEDDNPRTSYNNISKIDANGDIKETIYFSSVSDHNYPHKMIIDIPLDINSIKSITIGPNCKLNKKDINELFFIYGIPRKDIFKSKGTLR